MIYLILKFLFYEKPKKKKYVHIQKFQNVRAIKRNQFARGETMKLIFHLARGNDDVL